MSIFTMVLATLNVCLFAFIFYLETIITDSDKTAKVFGIERSVLQNKNYSTAMKNQGVYNLGFAILLLVATFVYQSSTAVMWLCLYNLFVALYGSLTVSKSLLLKQGSLAMLILISLLF